MGFFYGLVQFVIKNTFYEIILTNRYFSYTVNNLFNELCLKG